MSKELEIMYGIISSSCNYRRPALSVPLEGIGVAAGVTTGNVVIEVVEEGAATASKVLTAYRVCHRPLS